jgi:4-amino-4-deoxy-L-arabinose transferase-like glycosyltransferase
VTIEAPAVAREHEAPTPYAAEAERRRAIVLPWATIGLCALMFALAMAPRAAWVAYNDRLPEGFNDPSIYFIHGETIANGDGYQNFDGESTAYYPVGYPATVGGLMKAGDIFGWERSALSVKMLNGVLGAITTVLLFLLATRVAGRSVGVATGLLHAIFPSQVFYTGVVLSEVLFTMLLVASLLVLAWRPWSREGMPYPQLFAAGLLLSAATMTRGITLLVPLLLLGVWFFYMRSRRRALLQTLVVFAGIAVLIVPWAVRNSLALDTITGPSTNVGDDLCIGNFAGATGFFTLTGPCFEPYEHLSGQELEVTRNREGVKTAVTDIVQHPLRMPKLIFYKAYWLFYSDDDGLWAVESYGNDWFISHPRREILSFAANGIYYATVGLVVFGALAFALSRDIRRLFLALMMLYILAVPLAFFGDPRFKFPAMPIAIIIAAWTVMMLWQRRRAARLDEAPP